MQWNDGKLFHYIFCIERKYVGLIINKNRFIIVKSADSCNNLFG